MGALGGVAELPNPLLGHGACAPAPNVVKFSLGCPQPRRNPLRDLGCSSQCCSEPKEVVL